MVRSFIDDCDDESLIELRSVVFDAMPKLQPLGREFLEKNDVRKSPMICLMIYNHIYGISQIQFLPRRVESFLGIKAPPMANNFEDVM